MIPGWLAIGLGWLPVSANSTIMMFYICGYHRLSSRPMRMDYNLFRRACKKCWQRLRRKNLQRSHIPIEQIAVALVRPLSGQPPAGR